VPHDDCPVCEAPQPMPFLRREAVPVHQNLLFDTPAAARSVARGVLDLRVCGRCGFVFNTAFDPGLLDYGPAYENSQDCSPAFDAYLGELVDHLVGTRGIRNGRVVEIGCGKGAFLTRLLTHADNSSEGVGFDPSYLGPEVTLGGRLRFSRAFYSPSTAVPADVVVCRHVIEHVPDPLALLRTVRAATGVNRVRIFFETPCVEWILRHRVPWDLFYEHCSLFTSHCLGLALTRAGFAVSVIRHVFGGQYLWAEAVTGAAKWTTDCSETVRLARAFGDEERTRLTRWVRLVRELPGPVMAWGAGAKGVTFCNLTDPDARLLAGVVDVNPAKQGKYLPGTGHPIVSPEAAVAAGVAAVLVLNPNYTAEVADTLARLNSPAAVIDLMHREDARADHH
jgi:SAM-dependent methyltransferase